MLIEYKSNAFGIVFEPVCIIIHYGWIMCDQISTLFLANMKSHILKLSNNSSISFCNASKRFMATTHISNAVPPLNANEPCKFSPMNVPVGNFVCF